MKCLGRLAKGPGYRRRRASRVQPKNLVSFRGGSDVPQRVSASCGAITASACRSEEIKEVGPALAPAAGTREEFAFEILEALFDEFYPAIQPLQLGQAVSGVEFFSDQRNSLPDLFEPLLHCKIEIRLLLDQLIEGIVKILERTRLDFGNALLHVPAGFDLPPAIAGVRHVAM